MKNILKSTAMGIAIAIGLFLLVGIISDFRSHGELVMQSYAFSKMLLGSIVVGIGFGLPASIYKNETMPMLLKAVIHLGIGSVVLILVSVFVGWYPKEHILPAVAVQLAFTFLIWLGFYFYNKNLEKKMNRKIEMLKNQGE